MRFFYGTLRAAHAATIVNKLCRFWLHFGQNCCILCITIKERKHMYINLQDLYAAFAATPLQQRYAFCMQHSTYNLAYNINWHNCAAHWKQYAA